MSDQDEYKLVLGKPAFITIETQDGAASARLDVMEANRMLAEAERKPSEDQRWKYVREWMATKLNVSADSLAENSAFEFHQTIVSLTLAERNRIAKKVERIACLPPTTEACPADGSTGQTS